MASKPAVYNATLASKQLLTPTLGIFRVKPDEPMEAFIPGQYTVLGLNHPEKGAVLRAYSIASAPYLHNEYFEFYIRFVNDPASDNPMTHLLFKMEEGDRIYMQKKCRGKFTVEDCVGAADPRLKVFVAAGTGLAPFLSIVLQHQHIHGTPGHHAIIHGASYPQDLGYVEELHALMNEGRPHRRYLPTISRPKQVENWTGLAGRTDSHFEPEKLPALERELGLGEGNFHSKNCVVMICGLQGTIANTVTSLMHRGFVPEDRKLRAALGVPPDTHASIFWEQYDTTPIVDLKDAALIGQLRERLSASGVELLPPGSA